MEKYKKDMQNEAKFYDHSTSKKVPNLSKRPSLVGLKELTIKDLELYALDQKRCLPHILSLKIVMATLPRSVFTT